MISSRHTGNTRGFSPAPALDSTEQNVSLRKKSETLSSILLVGVILICVLALIQQLF